MADQDLQQDSSYETKQANENKPFDAEAIRDTNDHNSSIVDNVNFTIKTLIIENGLNQDVTFQCQGSAHSDFSNPFNINGEWDVTASTNTFQTCNSFIPYWRVVASCATAPTSGSLTVYIYGVKD